MKDISLDALSYFSEREREREREREGGGYLISLHLQLERRYEMVQLVSVVAARQSGPSPITALPRLYFPAKLAFI